MKSAQPHRSGLFGAFSRRVARRVGLRGILEAVSATVAVHTGR
jgi:hypothetical protein